MSLSRLIARPLMSSIFVVGPLKTWNNAPHMGEMVEPVTGPITRAAESSGIPLPKDPTTLIRVNAAVQVAAGVSLAIGFHPRIAATVLASSLVPTTLGGHRFWEADDPGERTQQQLQFAKNLSLLGGLIVAAGDTDGKPGLAWRARRAAKDARREAGTLAKEARREARTLARAARQEARVAKAKVA